MPFLGTTPTQGFVSAVTKQSFTPNGSTTVFTLSHSVANENDLEVFVGNVRQEPGSGKAYTAAGTTLTMSEAVASGVDFYVIFKNKAQVTTTPPDGSVSSAKLDTNIAVAGTLGVTGVSTLTGDLTVDGNTLHVDASNNKVGLGVDPGTMPSFITHAVVVPNGGGLGITSPASGNNRYIYFGTGTSSSDVQLAAIQNTSSDLIFKGASGAEKARILNSGGITFNGDTATANALDDYEEGEFVVTATPSAGGSITLHDSYNTASYTKIGRLVHVSGLLNVGSVSSPAGFIGLNLPFTPANLGERSGDSVGSVYITGSVSNFVRDYVATVNEGDARIFIQLGDGTSGVNDSANQIIANVNIVFTMSYHTS